MRNLKSIFKLYQEVIEKKSSENIEIKITKKECRKYDKIGDDVLNNSPISFIPSTVNGISKAYESTLELGNKILKNEHFSIDIGGYV